MATIYKEGSITRIDLAAGETSPTQYLSPGETIVVVNPGVGGTMLAQASWSMPRELQAGAGEWLDWDAGSVSVKTSQSLFEATALKISAATAAGIAEFTQ